jgi:hypothetical protein
MARKTPRTMTDTLSLVARAALNDGISGAAPIVTANGALTH